MKVKAIIMRPDHQNEAVRLSAKTVRENRFKHGDCEYLLDSKHFQLTSERTGPIKQHYVTYYYKQGVAKPLPVPDFEGQIIDRGITSQELSTIFTPYFYNVIANPGTNKLDRIQFYLLIGIAAAILYLVYLISKLPDRFVQALSGA